MYANYIKSGRCMTMRDGVEASGSRARPADLALGMLADWLACDVGTGIIDAMAALCFRLMTVIFIDPDGVTHERLPERRTDACRTR